MSVPTDQSELRKVVREKYAAAAAVTVGENPGSCCSAQGAIITDDQRELFGSPLYDQANRDELPDSAVLASLGCGKSDRDRRAA